MYVPKSRSHHENVFEKFDWLSPDAAE